MGGGGGGGGGGPTYRRRSSSVGQSQASALDAASYDRLESVATAPDAEAAAAKATQFLSVPPIVMTCIR